jgi:UDP-2,3-diacylglucosamine hydrolase
MLDRVAALRSEGRIGLPDRVGVLVKAPKPAQNLRIDLPSIGPETVMRAARAGLAGIAVVAGRAIVVEPGNVAQAADRANLFVIGVSEPLPRGCQ